MLASIFEAIGPIMIGPSSSHTAGAARLARVAGMIVPEPFNKVRFGLHGSFAKTYRGHGTDRALVAGILGLKEDDERLASSFEIAEKEGLDYEFYEIQLDGYHENSVCITCYLDSGEKWEIVGSSIGGAQIMICRINGFEVQFSASSPTLLVQQKDKKGILSDVTRILAEHGINIGVLRLSRRKKGGDACCIIEMDDVLPEGVLDKIRSVPNVHEVQLIEVEVDE